MFPSDAGHRTRRQTRAVSEFTMKAALCLALCLTCCVLSTESLSCYRGQGCTPEKIAELQCPLGTVTGPCQGCECAKGLGEECGGPWGVFGQCASGLTCRKDDDHFQSAGKCAIADAEEEKNEKEKPNMKNN
ncbi:venom protein 302-like [Penaeus monodon]|uniref:venom protein 302-like n=1 Tax=Penaeus monodon TaxID=6687 RepID=UPI0018A768B6|nr:venom protein 302-like [Penaeus monodon]